MPLNAPYSASGSGGDLSQQILRISLTRLTRLAAELAKKGNGRLPVQTRPGLNNSGIVPIRVNRTSSLLPLFLIHPVGGSVMAYYQLARYMRQEQPVYAIENQVVLNPEVRLSRTLPEMAAGYIEEIQSVLPNGPYLLGGYSMGGLVAFEMGRQLMGRGQEVRFLGLIDTPALVNRASESSGPDGPLTPNDLLMMTAIIARKSERAVNLTVQELERVAPGERLTYLVDTLKTQRIIPPHVDAALLGELVAVVRNNEEAQRRYIPQTYAGPVDLFRASEVAAELQAETAGAYQDPSFGWQAFCREPVAVHHVPGSHIRMMDQPHVQSLAVILQRRLDRRVKRRLADLY